MLWAKVPSSAYTEDSLGNCSCSLADGGQFSHCFDADADMHPALEGYLAFCNAYIDDVRRGTQLPLASASPLLTVSSPVVGPLVPSLWGQESPYNGECPNGTLVGCVATAMSQIMYKWKWPETGKGSMSYTSPEGLLKVDFSESTYDWDNMLVSGNTSEANAAAVAKLCYDCGVSVKMQYGDEASGSYDGYAFRAFSKYFKYAASKLYIEQRECVESEDVWNVHVKNELDHGRPILYCASDANGRGGHAFVIDGYDTDDNVHVNWGWSGRHNGYYALLTLLIKGYYQFSEGQSMIRGIVPDYKGTDNVDKQLKVYMASVPTVDDKSVSITDAFTVYGHDFYNLTQARIINVMIGLCDPDGNFIQEVASWIRDMDFSLMYGYGYSTYGFEVKLPEDLADGYYSLRIYFQEQGYKGWELPDMVGGVLRDRLPFLLENGKVTFNQLPTAIAAVESDGSRNGSTVYNLAGQLQKGVQHGFNIVDGKKIYVK